MLADADDPPIVLAASPDEARALVRAQAPLQPDFIKLWFVVEPGKTPADYLPTMQAVIDEAHQLDLPVAVHATELASARAALEAGADVLVHSVTDAAVDDGFVELMKRRQVSWTPTLGVMQGYQRVLYRELGLRDEERAWGSPDAIDTLNDLGKLGTDLLPDAFVQAWQQGWKPQPPTQEIANLKTLHAAGVDVAAGTDAGNPGTLHGASFFRELALMADAGLTPAEVLEAATLGGARLLGQEGEFGSITAGKSADLVLLDADPLADVGNFSRIHAVLNRGEYYTADAILADTVQATTWRDPDLFRTLGPEDQPEAVVDRQLAAYNARDLEAFVATYSPEVEIHTLGGAQQMQGTDTLRQLYGGLFQSLPQLHAEVTRRIAQGNYVIDHEHVSGLQDGASMEAIAIYEVQRGRIRRVWFPQ